MGDLVTDMGLGEIKATFDYLKKRGIDTHHFRRMRHYASIGDEVEKALKAPAVGMFMLRPPTNCKCLADLSTRWDLLIREWEGYESTKLPSYAQLDRLCLVEFGEPTSPAQARTWMVNNGIKPAGIGAVAVFACQGFKKADYGVIGPATRSKPADSGTRYVPGYRTSIAGKKPEVDRFALSGMLDSNEWRYLGIAEEVEAEPEA